MIRALEEQGGGLRAMTRPGPGRRLTQAIGNRPEEHAMTASQTIVAVGSGG
jgi:hypothetical protein